VLPKYPILEEAPASPNASTGPLVQPNQPQCRLELPHRQPLPNGTILAQYNLLGEAMRGLGLVAALLLLVDGVTPASAQVFVDQLTTPLGVLSVRPARGSVCGASSECKVVELNGRVLLHDYLATIDFA
jgi:hypothetical protein